MYSSKEQTLSTFRCSLLIVSSVSDFIRKYTATRYKISKEMKLLDLMKGPDAYA